jgi:hypothetical protein
MDAAQPADEALATSITDALVEARLVPSGKRAAVMAALAMGTARSDHWVAWATAALQHGSVRGPE